MGKNMGINWWQQNKGKNLSCISNYVSIYFTCLFFLLVPRITLKGKINHHSK